MRLSRLLTFKNRLCNNKKQIHQQQLQQRTILAQRCVQQ